MSTYLETYHGEVAVDGRRRRPIGSGRDRRRASADGRRDVGSLDRRAEGVPDRRGRGLDLYRFEPRPK